MESNLTHVDGGSLVTWTLTDARSALHMMRHVRSTLLASNIDSRVYLDGLTVKAVVALTGGSAMSAVSTLNATFTEGR